MEEKYDKQAADFLEKTGAKVLVKFLGNMSGHFGKNDKEFRDVYLVRLVNRKGKEYKFSFGDSLKNSQENRISEAARKQYDYEPAGVDGRPSAYDILSCLQHSEPTEDIDDFAMEFGYDKPTEAFRVFNAVWKEWKGIKRIFTKKEIEMLEEIV